MKNMKTTTEIGAFKNIEEFRTKLNEELDSQLFSKDEMKKQEPSLFKKIVVFFKHFNLLFSIQLLAWHKHRFDVLSRKLLYLHLGYKTQRAFNVDTANFFSRLLAVKGGTLGGDMRGIPKGRSVINRKINSEISKYIMNRIKLSFENRDVQEPDLQAQLEADERYKAIRMLILNELSNEMKRKDE